MDATTNDLTEDHLLKAMQQALRRAEEEGGDGALTAKEMVAALGVSIKRVYKAMDLLGNRLECVYVRRRDRANRLCSVPGYRLRQTQSGGSHDDQDHT
jgi:hypothetical protein